MQELIPINIAIGDRPYRIRIRPEDEGTVRQTLKTINDKIIEYKTQFVGKEMQDYISMVLLWFATEGGMTQSGTLSGDATASLNRMEEQLDRLLA